MLYVVEFELTKTCRFGLLSYCFYDSLDVCVYFHVLGTLTCLFCFCYISSACYIAEASFDTCLVWFRARLISPFREGRGQLGGFSILNWCNSRETIRKSYALLQSRKGDNSLLLEKLRFRRRSNPCLLDMSWRDEAQKVLGLRPHRFEHTDLQDSECFLFARNS